MISCFLACISRHRLTMFPDIHRSVFRWIQPVRTHFPWTRCSEIKFLTPSVQCSPFRTWKHLEPSWRTKKLNSVPFAEVSVWCRKVGDDTTLKLFRSLKEGLSYYSVERCARLVRQSFLCVYPKPIWLTLLTLAIEWIAASLNLLPGFVAPFHVPFYWLLIMHFFSHMPSTKSCGRFLFPCGWQRMQEN